MQLYTTDLDLDELCNKFGDWSTMDLVMRDWRETNSPLVIRLHNTCIVSTLKLNVRFLYLSRPIGSTN